MEELDGGRIPAMLAAYTQFQIRPRLAPLRDRLADQPAHSVPIDLHKGICFEDPFVQIERQKFAFHIITAEAEGGLSQIIGPEREKLGAFGKFAGQQAGPRQLDHRADPVSDALAPPLH